MHKQEIDLSFICKVVGVGIDSVKQRLKEFSHTETAKMKVEEIQSVDTTGWKCEQRVGLDPPAFIKQK
jgi:hypothetical protein